MFSFVLYSFYKGEAGESSDPKGGWGYDKPIVGRAGPRIPLVLLFIRHTVPSNQFLDIRTID